MTAQYIFLSHKSEDKPEVRQLVQQIEQHSLAKTHHVKVWLDEHSQDNTQTYVSQFAKAIVSAETCAFLLFVPQDSTDGYVQHEIETAFNRRMEDEKQGETFPIFPVYPNNQSERIKLPHPIQGFNYFENILQNEQALTDILSGALKLNVNRSAKGSEQYATQATSSSKQWLCYILSINGEEVTAEDFFAETTVRIPSNQLLPFTASEDYAATLEQLLPQLHANKENVKRLRIMTDDPELALLPWRDICAETTVELSPVARRYIEGFDDSAALMTPLAVIPEAAKHSIASNKHYSALVGYFNSHLGLRGPLPRVTSVDSLGRELQRHQPDFIYLYARYQNGSIVLDKSAHSAGTNNKGLTLEAFGQWLADSLTQTQMARPIVILSLIGGSVTTYPAQLAQHCKVLWIQSVRMRGDCHFIENQLARALESLTANKGDLVQAINQQSDKRVSSHLWVNGQPIRFDNHNGMPLSSQLRAALLRVMLGRDNLKALLRDKIDKPEHRASSSFLVYAVTGDAASCPFDVPAQLQSRLDWEDQEKGLPVIPLYFSLNVDPDADAYDQLDTMLDQGLRHGTNDMELAFQSMLERRGSLHEDSCIALNWSIHLPSGMAGQLGHWLEVWGEVMADYIADYIPPRTIMLSALCIQVEDQTVAQSVQDTANQSLQTLRNHGIRLIRVREALGKLYDDEIADFFNDNEHWREHLKLTAHGIDTYRYAEWIHDHTNGEFDATVNKIWQQYQNNYQDYPTS